MIDVGGTSVKLMASGHEGLRKFRTGRGLTAAKMVKGVVAATEDWAYEAISLGFRGLVREGRIARNPLNLSGGWMDFDFDKAFKKPVRVINDAAMQALARYEAGRMLFVGLGTSVGAALIADDTIVPVEIGIMRLSKSEGFMDRLSKEALESLGKARWQKAVTEGARRPARWLLAGSHRAWRRQCEASRPAARRLRTRRQPRRLPRRVPPLARRGHAR